MAMRLIPASGQGLAAAAVLAALSACATSTTEPAIDPPVAGWRIVERTGEARYSLPGAAAWVSATTGQALADGSEVATGRGGRLIVDAPGRHISVGPDSRFVLPDQAVDDRLEQRSGWLRYRIAGAQPFRIHTRSLELELTAGVVDVQVNHLATEVSVKEGQVRVTTPDGLRQSQMIAGQSAQARGVGGIELAVREAPGEALQPIEPTIVPAIQPKGPPAETSALEATATEAPASPAAAATAQVSLKPSDAPPATDHSAQARPSHPSNSARKSVAPPVSDDTPAQLSPAPTTGSKAAPPRNDGRPAIAADARHADPAALRRSQFDRLTAGLLDGIQPPRPAPTSHGPSR